MNASAGKRLSGWAANLFASGLILVAGVGLGRQVLQWWRTDSAARNAPALTAPSDLGNPDQPHAMEFGDVPLVLRRTTHGGSKETVFAALREQGRQALSQTPVVLSAPGPAETRMLARICKLTPVATQYGEWELYELDGPMLMVCGVRLADSPDRRVVYWGMAFPSMKESDQPGSSWTLFSFSAAGASASSKQLADISLPAGARRTLSLVADDGSRLVGFRGSRDSAAWQRHFETHFSREGFAPSGDWRETAGGWYGRFDKSGVLVEVQWNLDNDEVTGLITVTPIPDSK